MDAYVQAKLKATVTAAKAVKTKRNGDSASGEYDKQIARAQELLRWLSLWHLHNHIPLEKFPEEEHLPGVLVYMHTASTVGSRVSLAGLQHILEHVGYLAEEVDDFAEAYVLKFDQDGDQMLSWEEFHRLYAYLNVSEQLCMERYNAANIAIAIEFARKAREELGDRLESESALVATELQKAKYHAATVIQCAFRKRLAIQEVEEARNSIFYERQNAAAIKIQCQIRLRTARKKVLRKKRAARLMERQTAAIKLQAFFRRIISSQLVRGLREEREFERAVKQQNSAITIQCAYRQAQSRWVRAALQEAHYSARVIQAAERRRRAQREVRKLRAARTNDQAATKIQCAERQRQARVKVLEERIRYGDLRRADSVKDCETLVRRLAAQTAKSRAEESTAAIDAALTLANAELVQFGQQRIDDLVRRTRDRVHKVVEEERSEIEAGRTTSAVIRHRRRKLITISKQALRQSHHAARAAQKAADAAAKALAALHQLEERRRDEEEALHDALTFMAEALIDTGSVTKARLLAAEETSPSEPERDMARGKEAINAIRNASHRQSLVQRGHRAAMKRAALFWRLRDRHEELGYASSGLEHDDDLFDSYGDEIDAYSKAELVHFAMKVFDDDGTDPESVNDPGVPGGVQQFAERLAAIDPDIDLQQEYAKLEEKQAHDHDQRRKQKQRKRRKTRSKNRTIPPPPEDDDGQDLKQSAGKNDTKNNNTSTNENTTTNRKSRRKEKKQRRERSKKRVAKVTSIYGDDRELGALRSALRGSNRPTNNSSTVRATTTSSYAKTTKRKGQEADEEKQNKSSSTKRKVKARRAAPKNGSGDNVEPSGTRSRGNSRDNKRKQKNSNRRRKPPPPPPLQ